MFTIYSDKDIFDNIISSPDNYPNWNKIINDHSVVFLDINEADFNKEVDNPDTFLFLFLQANARNIEIVPIEKYFQTIYANLETVVKNPSAAYFLNLTDIVTEKLQQDTGIIVNNANKIDDELLLKGIYNHWVSDETIVNNWNTILNSFQNFPSNSIIINDRNLFTNNERIGTHVLNLGTDNILRILNALLPQNINIDYHILIQTDHQINRPGIENKNKCDEISDFLNTEIRNLRPYNFIIEMIYIHSSTQYYPHTHNRKIISNYKTGSISHCFSAFKIRTPDKTKNDDYFTLNAFFDKINNPTSRESNLREHSIGIQRFKETTANCISKINLAGPNDYAYRYYLNGEEVILGQTTAINNRLLN